MYDAVMVHETRKSQKFYVSGQLYVSSMHMTHYS